MDLELVHEVETARLIEALSAAAPAGANDFRNRSRPQRVA